MSEKNPKIAEQLRKMETGYRSHHSGQSIGDFKNALAQAVGLRINSIERWLGGGGIASKHIPVVCKWGVYEAGLGRQWVLDFLEACDYAATEDWVEELLKDLSLPPYRNNAT
jgi:hypothetical protein